MAEWSSRRDPRGTSTFISYTSHTVELLWPPSAEPAWPKPDFDEAPNGGLFGGGLWTWACWDRHEDLLIDLDPPTCAERVRTVTVAAWVGDELRADVRELMHQQVRHTWLLSDPQDTCPPAECRTQQPMPLLLQRLQQELLEAFPDEDARSLRGITAPEPPTGESPPSAAPPPAAPLTAVKLLIVIGLLVRARLSGKHPTWDDIARHLAPASPPRSERGAADEPTDPIPTPV